MVNNEYTVYTDKLIVDTTRFFGPEYPEYGGIMFRCAREIAEVSDSVFEAALVFDGLPLWTTFQMKTPEPFSDSLDFTFSETDILGQFGTWVSS